MFTRVRSDRCANRPTQTYSSNFSFYPAVMNRNYTHLLCYAKPLCRASFSASIAAPRRHSCFVQSLRGSRIPLSASILTSERREGGVFFGVWGGEGCNFESL